MIVRTGKVGAPVPPHVAAIADAQRGRWQQTVLDVRFDSHDYAAFFNYVRSEWPDKPCQLMAHPTTKALCVRGTFGDVERARLLDLVNQFEAILRTSDRMEVTVLPPSRKRQIRRRNYQKRVTN